MTDIPHRIRIDLFTPTERAIYDAVQAVEAMPPDVWLTRAVILLQQARECVADFVDGTASKPWSFAYDDRPAPVAATTVPDTCPKCGGTVFFESHEPKKCAMCGRYKTYADRPAPAAAEGASERKPMCEHCGKRPATCIGRYDAMDFDAHACDECCAHGCEDGHCEPLAAHPAPRKETSDASRR